MAPISIEYLRSFPALADMPESRLRELVEKLTSQWIDTTDVLATVTKKELLDAGIPLVAAKALKPEEEQRWYQLSGRIDRPTSHGGARYKLFQIASPDGFYPQGLDAESAFACQESGTAERSIIEFSVVFKEEKAAKSFMEELDGYILHNDGDLHLVDDQGNEMSTTVVARVQPFPTTISTRVSKSHYKPHDGEELAPGSPPLDMVWATRSNDFSIDNVTFLSTSDPVFTYQRLEIDSCFRMAAPESAHIFPSAKCKGQFEWLDKAGCNHLALSREFHLNYDGTARGRGKTKKRKTAQTVAFRPLRSEPGFLIVDLRGTSCYRIPLELVFNVNEVARPLLGRLGNNASIDKSNDRWTITGTDVCIFYPRERPLTLLTESTDEGDTVLVSAIPGVNDLAAGCWSNSTNDLYTVEAAEVLEKCLLWNYQNALESWQLAT